MNYPESSHTEILNQRPFFQVRSLSRFQGFDMDVFRGNLAAFGLSRWLSGKESACNAGATGDWGLISRSGRSPGGGHGNPLQYPCLGNPMDRGAWQATVRGVSKSWTRLSSTHLAAFFHMAFAPPTLPHPGCPWPLRATSRLPVWFGGRGFQCSEGKDSQA